MSTCLTKNGIKTLLESQHRLNQDILVQIFNIKSEKAGQYLPCMISDGYMKIKAAISSNESAKLQADYLNYALMRVKKHSIIKIGQILRGFEIQQYEIQSPYPQIIGDPVNFSADADISQQATNIINLDLIRGKNSLKKRTATKPIEGVKQTGKKQQKPVMISLEQQIDSQEGKVNTSNLSLEEINEITLNRLKQSDKIVDLYVQLQNWQIICRINDMNYKQFVSKKSQKFTQILTVELMDRTEMKIQGTAFGEFAKQLKDQLKLNNLYKISRGQIRQDSYSNNKGPKFSRFNIYFTKNSLFVLLQDNKLIPKISQDNYSTIQQLISQKTFDKQYDVAAIMTEIGQIQELTDKNGLPLKKRIITICDPENNKTMEVTLWRQLDFDENLKGQTVLLKNFKLNSYMSNLSLNSLFKSQIKALPNHRYKEFEKKLNPATFDRISSAQQVDESQKCQTIKQLQSEITYNFYDSQTLYSNLNCYVSMISFKGKWFYQSCPKCKKGGAQEKKTCINCGEYVQEPVLKFIIPIEIADFTGSIWTTAFDDFANVLLKGKDIKLMKRMDEVKLRQFSQKLTYQQFRFRIATKRQATSQIKHRIMGKPFEMNPEKTANDNIARIYQYE